ncbi:hypothetical protein HWV62_16848 [Athelia sp. TMB]|nr:hypothetical protein HWV62_16848 [Athelia sp. TMB]
MSTVSTSVASSTPVSTLCSDPMQFLQTLKGVSEKVRVDEMMRAKKRLVSGEIKASTSSVGSIRSGKQKENLRRSTSAIKDRARSPIVISASRSLPVIESGDVDLDIEMDKPNARMDIDVDQKHAHSVLGAIAPEYPRPLKRDNSGPKIRASMPPPPVPVPKAPSPSDANLSARPAPALPPQQLGSLRKVTPPPPIIHVSVPTTKPESPPSPPRTQPVPLSSSQRPRALGMRRAFNTYHTISSQNLPEKQRGFKVPLAKPSYPPISAPSSKLANPRREAPAPFPSPPSPLDNVRGGCEADPASKETGTDEGSFSPAEDPDSSYGDMSFDMDALEETMQMYD